MAALLLLPFLYSGHDNLTRLQQAPGDVHMLPAMMTIWCAGRLLFWVGYRHSLNARIIGMDWTTVTAMLAAAWLNRGENQ